MLVLFIFKMSQGCGRSGLHFTNEWTEVPCHTARLFLHRHSLFSFLLDFVPLCPKDTGEEMVT